MSYSDVLVAVDLSEESRKVLEAARAVSGQTGARLHLATVIKPLTQVYGGLDMTPISRGNVSFEDEALTQAKAQLAALASDYRIAAEDVHVIMGSPGPEIRRLAVDAGADLIVLGSHGRHGFNLLLGSTANAVLHDAGCNVLAVRLDYD